MRAACVVPCAVLASLLAAAPTTHAQCGACDQVLTLNITFDEYPREVTWTLQESINSTVRAGGGERVRTRVVGAHLQAPNATRVVCVPMHEQVSDCSVEVSASGGPYNDASLYEVISSEVCAFQTYNFTIFDENGDGICCGNPNNQQDHGHYSLLLGDIEVASGGRYDYKETTLFGTELPPSQTPTPVPTPAPTITPIPTISQAPTVCPCTQTAALEITFDEYPTDVTWVLNTTELSPSAECTESLSVTGGPYALSTESVSVDMSTQLCAGQTYRFTILDDSGNGLCCEWGDGSYTVTLNGETVGSGDEYGASDSFTFTAPQSPTLAPTVGTENPTPAPTST